MINTGYPSYTNEIRIGEDNSANKIYFDIVTGTGTLYKVWAASAPLLNTWHHVVAQRNSSSIELYIDGVLQGSTICNNQIIDHNTYGWGYSFFFIGFDISTSGWSYFDGSLDDIRVYDRVLTDTEIQFLKSN